jgi:hypothetical protein
MLTPVFGGGAGAAALAATTPAAQREALSRSFDMCTIASPRCDGPVAATMGPQAKYFLNGS